MIHGKQQVLSWIKIAIKMIKGIGTDIIEISRIRETYLKYGKKFLMRILTEKEQQYCTLYKDFLPHLAGRFSAKEAIAKALGVGFGSRLSWLDIEILNNPLGQPQVTLAKNLMQNFDNPQLIVSISHCKDYATATALWLYAPLASTTSVYIKENR
jgi:holo-[acyl-carrier protein] synthase